MTRVPTYGGKNEWEGFDGPHSSLASHKISSDPDVCVRIKEKMGEMAGKGGDFSHVSDSKHSDHEISPHSHPTCHTPSALIEQLLE